MNRSESCFSWGWFRLLVIATAAGLAAWLAPGVADAAHGGGGRQGHQGSHASQSFSSAPSYGNRSGENPSDRNRFNYQPAQPSIARSSPSARPQVYASQAAPRSVSSPPPPLTNRMSANVSRDRQPRELGRFVASEDRQDRSFEGGRSEASSRAIQRTAHESNRSESSSSSRESTFSKDRGSVKDLRGKNLDGNPQGRTETSNRSGSVQTDHGPKSGSDRTYSGEKSIGGGQTVLRGVESRDLKGATVRDSKAGDVQNLKGGVSKELKGGASKELKGGAPDDFKGGASKELKGGASKELKGGATKDFKSGRAPGDFKGGASKELKGGVTKDFKSGRAPGEFKGGVKGPTMKVRDFGKRGVPDISGSGDGRKIAKGEGYGKSGSYKDFSHRAGSGQLDHLTKGPVAKQFNIGDQYRMHKDGDVARRMGLYTRTNHHYELAHHESFHRYIHPSYPKSCFRFHYWGPSFFLSYCWYPNWTPWVGWSWYYSCDPYWDPRPLWCRPIIYRPCVRWVYWEVPVWTTLPVEPSGTWVDVPPVAVEAAKNDLQLLAVRFVDPGHPEEKLGPRYRVWFRNNGGQAIGHPFSVMLFASNDGKLAADLPQAGVRVPSIAAGAVQSVDIRLPIEVYQMGRDAKGEAAPFATLHALADANQELVETTKANNGATIARGDLLPVDPAAFEVKPAEAAAGAEVLLAGEGLGPEPGQVLVHLGGIEMEAEILGWYDLGVRLSLPNLPLAGPTDAELVVVRADGAAANPLSIKISPPQAAAPILAPPAVEKTVEKTVEKKIPPPPAPEAKP